MTATSFRSFTVAALLCVPSSSLAQGTGRPAPVWTAPGQTIAADAITDDDHEYLRQWIEEHAQPADDYFVSLFRRHDVVAFGEAHNLREHKAFIINLVPRLYHEAGVRCIGWEFTSPASDAALERLVTASTFDYRAQLDFARAQGSHAWPSKEHWDIIEAVRALNATLPEGAPRMRMVGIDKEIDWVDVYTKQKTAARDSPEMKALAELQLRRDLEMAENAERQTLARGEKALLFVGSGHAETHLGLPPGEPFRRPIMAQELYKKYGDRVFHVCPDSGLDPTVNRAMKGHALAPAGFDVHQSPFANVLFTDGAWTRRMASIARGFIYFGPRATLHRNTFIEGFVTDEMFSKYGNYYQIDFGRPFKSAEEVNAYFRERALAKLK